MAYADFSNPFRPTKQADVLYPFTSGYAASMPAIRPTSHTPAITAAEAGIHLSVQCLRCRHRGLLMAGQYGVAGQRPLGNLWEILRCTRCGILGEVTIGVAEVR